MLWYFQYIHILKYPLKDFPGGLVVKNPPAMQWTPVQSTL